MHFVTVLTLIFFTLLNLSLSSPTPDSNFSLTGPVNDNLGLGCTCNVSQSGYYCGFEFPFIIGQCDNNMVYSSNGHLNTPVLLVLNCPVAKLSCKKGGVLGTDYCAE